MAKYISRDALLEMLSERLRNTCNGSLSCIQMKRLVESVPTADVAPKSEVEKYKLIHKYIKNTILNDCDYSTADAYNRAFNKELDKLTDIVVAKSEVAREIFAEIEDALDKICIVYNAEDDFPAVVAKIFNKTIAALDELKKKYTEGEG